MLKVALRRSSHVLLTGMVLIIALLLFTRPTTAQEDVMGTLTIPALDISTEIVNAPLGNPSWDVSHLDMNVGHLQGSAWVGGSDNILLGGHSLDINGNPDIFYRLDELQPDDEIFITTGDEEFRYVVSDINEVDFRDVSVLYSNGAPRLTLLTCATSSQDAASGAFLRRVVVFAYPQ